MSEKEIAEITKDIIEDVYALLSHRLGYLTEEIFEMIDKSDLKNRIKEAPEVFLHLSDEQLMDSVR